MRTEKRGQEDFAAKDRVECRGGLEVRFLQVHKYRIRRQARDRGGR